MENDISLKKAILDFNKDLAKMEINLPEGFEIVNPFAGEGKNQIEKVTNLFYGKFYDDNKKRRIILGSSPARRGTAITGIPYEDAAHLQKETGIFIDNFYVNKSSSNFLYDVIETYGGCEKFYSDFYMNFVCPLGIVRVKQNGNRVNCNYYENKQVEKTLYSFIVQSLKRQMKFNIDTSVCYCIGSGENYEFLEKLNKEYNFFETIIPLEHPRFIMQYNSKNKDMYLDKYLNAFRYKSEREMEDDYER